MTLDTIFFEKKNQNYTNYYILLPFSLFVCFLPSPTNKWPHTKLSMSEEGAIEYILTAKTWLDGFDSVFWKVSVAFCLLFFYCSFLLLKKFIKDRS